METSNQRKRRRCGRNWFAALAVAALLLSILPTAAFAAGSYLVWLNGSWLGEGETTVGGGRVILDAENKTLTMENVALDSFVSFEAGEEFTLIVKGTNTVAPTSGEVGITTAEGMPKLNILLEEGASLTITADTSNAIYVRNGGLRVSGPGALTANSVGGYPTVYVAGDTVFENSTVNITGDQVGLFVQDPDWTESYSVVMRGAAVDIDVTAGTTQAVYCSMGDITIENTVLTTKTEGWSDESEGFGLYTDDGSILIKGDGSNVVHTGAIGFFADQITVEGGKVDVKTADTALCGYNGVSITGGGVKAESTMSYAILGTRGPVSITGEKTEVTAITGAEDYAAISNANAPNNPAFGDGGVHLDAKVTVKGKKLIVGVKKNAESAITLGPNFEIAGAALKTEAVSDTKSKTYFVAADGGSELTGEAVVCKHRFGGAPNWTWSADHTSATATFPCIESGDYSEVLTAAVTSKTTPATCTAAGKTVYTAEITFLGTNYSDTREVPIAIDKNAHGEIELRGEREATCSEKGYTGDRVCKDCGAIVEKGQEIELKAHVFVDGRCTVCGAAEKPDDSADRPQGATDSPETGSGGNAVFGVSLLFVAGAVLTGTAIHNRKRKYNR